MYILAFETTGEKASVACIDEKGGLICESSDGPRNHLQSLMPMTQSLLKKNGITSGDISCVAASCGPGSFTGIRIGVTTARAFAQAAGIPCIAVPTLPAFIYNIEEYNGLVCPILDARRDQVYGGAYIWNKNKTDIVTAVAGGAYGIKEYLELLSLKVSEIENCDIMFFGDGLKKYQNDIQIWGKGMPVGFAEGGNRLQKAPSAAKLALKLWNEGKRLNFNEFMPLYMRKAEAERKLEANNNERSSYQAGE